MRAAKKVGYGAPHLDSTSNRWQKLSCPCRGHERGDLKPSGSINFERGRAVCHATGRSIGFYEMHKLAGTPIGAGRVSERHRLGGLVLDGDVILGALSPADRATMNRIAGRPMSDAYVVDMMRAVGSIILDEATDGDVKHADQINVPKRLIRRRLGKNTNGSELKAIDYGLACIGIVIEVAGENWRDVTRAQLRERWLAWSMADEEQRREQGLVKGLRSHSYTLDHARMGAVLDAHTALSDTPSLGSLRDYPQRGVSLDVSPVQEGRLYRDACALANPRTSTSILAGRHHDARLLVMAAATSAGMLTIEGVSRRRRRSAAAQLRAFRRLERDGFGRVLDDGETSIVNEAGDAEVERHVPESWEAWNALADDEARRWFEFLDGARKGKRWVPLVEPPPDDDDGDEFDNWRILEDGRGIVHVFTGEVDHFAVEAAA